MISFNKKKSVTLTTNHKSKLMVHMYRTKAYQEQWIPELTDSVFLYVFIAAAEDGADTQPEKQQHSAKSNERHVPRAVIQNSPFTVAINFFLEILMCEYFLLFRHENLHKNLPMPNDWRIF